MRKPVSDELLRQIPRVGMALILGSEGSGKSNLAYGILESLKDFGRKLYVHGLPLEKQIYLPDWLNASSGMDFPENSIVLADEAHIMFYSRDSMSNANKYMDTFSGLVRQKDILAIYITQFARKLELGLVSAPRVLLIKQPSLLQMRLDRSALRPLLASATEAFKFIEDTPAPPRAASQLRQIEKRMSELGSDTEVSPRCLIATYVISNRFEGMIDPSNYSPSFWSEELSKAWKGVSLTGEYAPPWTRNQVLCVDCNNPAIGTCLCHGNSYCAEHAAGHRMVEGRV